MNTTTRFGMLRGRRLSRGAVFGIIILCALLAFEVFNFSSTQFALMDILGTLAFAGIRWSTILALAFCGIDFAGIARIFTPEQGANEPKEVWYLLGAWFLAAAFNASLTWWGVSVAVLTHQSQGGVALMGETFGKIIPIFVAAMVLLIRVLLINTFSIAGERLFTTDRERTKTETRPTQQTSQYRPQPMPKNMPTALPRYNPNTSYTPTYHPVGMDDKTRKPGG